MAEILPVSLGLPARFQRYRPGQLEAAIDIVASDKRISAVSAPTGSGKSGLTITIANLLDSRTLYLTATKNLQRQVTDEFKSIGLLDIRGQANYRCVALDKGGYLEGFGVPGSSCLEGPCRVGVHCHLRNRGCTYYDSVKAAREARIVVTNYAFWLSLGRHGDPETLGKFDLLICDEAHDSAEWLTDFCAVELDGAEVQKLIGESLPPVDEGVDVWSAWARENGHKAKRKAEGLRLLLKQRPANRQQLTKELLRLSALERDLAEMARAKSWRRTEQASKQVEVPGEMSDWIAYRTAKGARFTPVWSHQYAEELLFRSIPKIVLSSGTLLPSIVNRLGIQSDQYDWHEVKSSFDPARRPLIYIPTTRVDQRMVEGQKRMWINRIDQILSTRLDRKVLIHSVSYARAVEIYERSRYGKKASTDAGDVMLLHSSSRETHDLVQRFKNAKAPCVLVSPAMTEGVDFPDNEVRCIILAKVPFASSADPLFKQRCKQDPNYRFECAAQTIIQMAGRGMRAASDWVECFIADDHFSYLRSKTSWPSWFSASWRQYETVPPPLKVAA